MDSSPLDLTERDQYTVVDKRLSRLFNKASSAMLFPLFALSICQQGRHSPLVIAASILTALTLSLNALALVHAGKMRDEPDMLSETDDPTRATRDERKNTRRLCIAAYMSVFLLMSTAASLAGVLNPFYVVVAAPVLALFLPLFGILIRLACENGLEWGAVKYKEHQSDLSFFYDVASGITEAGFAGLSALLFGHSKSGRCGHNVTVKAAESLILYATLLGPLMMLLCCVPPALKFSKGRQKVVETVFRIATNVLMVFMAGAASVATSQILGVYVVGVLGVAVVGMVAILLFLKAFLKAPAIDESVGPKLAEHRDAAGEQSLLWLGFNPVMFAVLMVSYSASTTGQAFSVPYRACLLFMFAAVVSNLARIVSVREAHGKCSEVLVHRFRLLTIVLMTGTLILWVLVALRHPSDIIDAFVSVSK